LTVSAQDSSYVPSHELPEGQELVFVYLGSYDCGPCHKPELKRAINEAKLLLDQKAEEAGKSFSAAGVDMGWSVEKGIDFLRETGRFDEIMVGRSWTGSAGTRYIWREEVTSPSKPSIVVYERRVTPEDRISISEPTYLVSKSGASNIVEWVEDGAPLRNGSSGGKR
jgi:hypothetical protein